MGQGRFGGHYDAQSAQSRDQILILNQLQRHIVLEENEADMLYSEPSMQVTQYKTALIAAPRELHCLAGRACWHWALMRKQMQKPEGGWLHRSPPWMLNTNTESKVVCFDASSCFSPTLAIYDISQMPHRYMPSTCML